MNNQSAIQKGGARGKVGAGAIDTGVDKILIWLTKERDLDWRKAMEKQEIKVTSAFDAETVVRRIFERQHGDLIKQLTFYKCWYSSSGNKEF